MSDARAITAPDFDYAALTSAADVLSEARTLAADILSFQRRSVEEAHEVGRRLLALRSRVDEGQFVRWLEHEVGIAKSSAYRFMALAENIEPEAVSHVGKLGATVAYRLTAKATPADTRDEIVGRLQAGESLTADRVAAVVRTAQVAAKRDRQTEAKRRHRREMKDESLQQRRRRRQEREEREADQRRAEADRAREAAVTIIVRGLSGPELETLLLHLDRLQSYVGITADEIRRGMSS